MSISKIIRVCCDRCRREIDTANEREAKAWARIGYGYLSTDQRLEWVLCPNCRLLFEQSMIEMRLLDFPAAKTQFGVEVALAAIVEDPSYSIQRPETDVRCRQCDRFLTADKCSGCGWNWRTQEYA